MTQGLPIVGAAGIGPFGLDYRGMARRLGGDARHSRSAPPIPPEADVGDRRSRRLMSRSAHLCAVTLHRLLDETGWRGGLDELGFFLGVGESTCGADDLFPMFRESLEGERFSLERFGARGLTASPPLVVFQLLNNFTLCHGAILEGIGGPNGVYYSSAGTVTALAQAAHAIAEGQCRRAVAGAADHGLSPICLAELARNGFTADGLEASEGSGLLALAAEAQEPIARLERCKLLSTRGRGLASAAETALESLGTVDAIVIAPWGRGAREGLLQATSRRHRNLEVVDLTSALGDALAATPALGWLAAIDLLTERDVARAVVLSAGIDGQLGVVALGRGAAA